MLRDERNLLEILKDELQFFERGSYRNNTRDLWRPRFFLEDSPSCPNHDAGELRRPCADCALIELVPAGLRNKKIPCRHIPLTSDGQTLDSLYRSADDEETEEIFRAWLRTTISNLQKTPTANCQHSKTTALDAKNKIGQPLFCEKLTPKCANQSCKESFSWHNGGSFFRFSFNASESELQHGVGAQQVRHYWLCESCSHVFTLNHHQGQGVVLEIRSSLAMAKTAS